MALPTTCPPPPAFGGIPNNACAFNLGQIQKVIFRRLTATTEFTPTNILLQATWDTAIAAADDDKIVVTPFVENMLIPGSEPVTEGGNDNTTLNGIEIVAGDGNPIVTGFLASITPASAKAIRAIQGEAGVNTNVGVFFINEFGEIIGDVVGANVRPFRIFSMFLSSRDNQGKNTRDRYNLRFALDGSTWDDDLAKYTPTDFNARFDLNPAS